MVKLPLDRFSFNFLSDLCFNGQIFAVSDPLGMVPNEYGLTNRAVEDGVVVEQTNHGFTAQMDEKLVKGLPLADKYQPVGENRHRTSLSLPSITIISLCFAGGAASSFELSLSSMTMTSLFLKSSANPLTGGTSSEFLRSAASF